MTRTQLRWTGLALGVALVAGTVVAQQAPDRPNGTVGQKVGEALDRTGQSIRQGVGEAADSLKAGFARSRTAVHNMGLETRIYGRLHWDKALVDAPIELDAQQGGLVILRGSVPSAEARSKAVALAQETVGVLRVEDQLTVGPPPASTTTTTTTRRTDQSGPDSKTTTTRETTRTNP
ncbi:MAG TPA: BON domain-containing protein [Isosphaeraceae bacterium]